MVNGVAGLSIAYKAVVARPCGQKLLEFSSVADVGNPIEYQYRRLGFVLSEGMTWTAKLKIVKERSYLCRTIKINVCLR